DWLGEAMDRLIIGPEDDQGSEFGDDLLDHAVRLVVVELEETTEFTPPARVQVHQRIEVPVEPQPGIDVEVGVRAEDAAGTTAVDSTTLEVGIRDERLDSRDFLEEHEERT